MIKKLNFIALITTALMIAGLAAPRCSFAHDEGGEDPTWPSSYTVVGTDPDDDPNDTWDVTEIAVAQDSSHLFYRITVVNQVGNPETSRRHFAYIDVDSNGTYDYYFYNTTKSEHGIFKTKLQRWDSGEKNEWKKKKEYKHEALIRDIGSTDNYIELAVPLNDINGAPSNLTSAVVITSSHTEPTKTENDLLNDPAFSGYDPTKNGNGGGLFVKLESFTAVGSNGQITLSWSSASEIDSAGFNILRSETPNGEYVRVNYALVPTQGDPFSGFDYTYTDYTVINGVAYHYLLEEIEFDGDTNLYGPASAMPGIISLLNPGIGGDVLLNDPHFDCSAAPDVKRMVLYISSSQTLKGKGTMRLKVKRSEPLRAVGSTSRREVKLGKRAQRRLAKLASRNGWTLYCGVYGQIKGEKGMKLLSNVNEFNCLLGVKID